MAFITDSNARRIINKTELKSVEINGKVFLHDIYFFSDFEMTQLLAYKEFIQNVDKFIREIYKPIVLKKDSFTLIYEYDEEKPAFHKSLNCSHLKKDYKNYTIPDEIRYKENGQLDFNKIWEFRKWFKSVQNLFEFDKEAFVARLNLRWGIVTNPQALELSNTGPNEFVNYDIGELTDKINQLIKQAGRYYYLNSRNKAILKQYSKYTFLAYRDDPLVNNITGFPDAEVKVFLREYDESIKRPLKKLLREYYKIQYNPDLNFQSELLLTLNFKPCSSCYDAGDITKEDVDPTRGQFLKKMNETEGDYENEFMKEYMNSVNELRNKDF